MPNSAVFNNQNISSVAVVILNYNGRSFLEQFLPSVVKFSGNAEIIVADNASTDDSLDFLRANYPQIRLIEMKENRWFCGGYNLALSQVEAEYYVLLNSDVEVTPDWIPPVLNLMASDEKIVACHPKIKLFADKTKFEHAGGAGGMIDFLGYPFCRGRIFEELENDSGQYDDNIPVFWATGACMFVKAKTYHEFGGLDEIYFAHMEEIDFCWRVKNAGLQVWYCGESEVFHVGGGTMPKIQSEENLLEFPKFSDVAFQKLTWFAIALHHFCQNGFGWSFCADVPIEKRNWKLQSCFPSAYSFLPTDSETLETQETCPIQPENTQHKERMNLSIVWKHFVQGVKYFKDL